MPGRITLASEPYRPATAQVGYFVGEVVRLVRERPLDPVVMRQQWDKAYEFLAGPAVNAMNDFAAADAGMKGVLGEGSAARTVEIGSILQKSADSYQVRWVETTYAGGTRRTREEYTGLFQTKLMPPRDESDSFKNPIGVYVTNFTWSREFSEAVQREEHVRPAPKPGTDRSQQFRNWRPAMNQRKPNKHWSVSMSTLIAIATAVGGCESYEPPTVQVLPDHRLKAATLLPDDGGSPPKIIEVKVPVTGPQLRAIGGGSEAKSKQTGLAAIFSAQASATTQPISDGFLNAVQYYDYAPGLVYTAVTSPGFVTTIALRPNEKLITAAAGDTTRWIVDSVQSGSGESAQTLLLVKPRKSGLQTNLLVTTDQRIYTLDLSSTESGAYHTMIAWNYPFGDVVMIRNQAVAQQVATVATVATGLDLTKSNFNYQILKQKHTPTSAWCPLRAFDDGRKTYIQFPPKIAVTEAPPLFVLGTRGEAQLVNYRVKGDWYIVDRLFDKAELRLGQNPQTVVAIVRSETKE